LRVRQASGDDHRSYLQFSVTGLGGTVTNAKLRLFAYDGTDSGGTAYSVTTGWTESGTGSITWNNAPPLGASLGSVGNVPINTWAEYDVSDAVAGNGTFAFAVANVSTDSPYFRSRESTASPQNKPELRIETVGGFVLARVDAGSAAGGKGPGVRPVDPRSGVGRIDAGLWWLWGR